MPDWECLWSDFTQEELRFSLVQGTTGSSSKGPKVEEEENVVLASKGKATKGPNQGQGSKEGEKKKKDLSKIKCFRYGELVITTPNVPRRTTRRGGNRQQL